MNILVFNCGSSSLKYQLIDMQSETSLLKGQVEKIGQTVKTHQEAIAIVVDQLKEKPVHGVGHRVVHGGSVFTKPVVINASVLEELQALNFLAPLHNPYNLQGIQAALRTWPKLKQVAVFDTSFHAGLPRRAKYYGLNKEVAEEFKIQKFGFHGPSHNYVSDRASEFLGVTAKDLKIISLHLGNGASACAVEYGKSVETSMGMTPLEGLLMGTRSGDIDPGVIFALAKKYDLDDIENILNKKSGLLGLSGLSNDLRDIQDQAEQGNDDCRLAINAFAHRVRKYIGAYAAVMGGVDLIVFTGGIGENSASMRRRVLQRLDFLGVDFDEDLNNESHDKQVQMISSNRSRTKVLVVKTNEELMIAKETNVMINKAEVSADLVIPIAVSARHLHLDKETFAKLFGEGKEPTKYKDISQPGQYACHEKVNLIGPRGVIKGVRLLGPLRPANQIEISRTDEYKLGVDAPIRDSGKVKDSAPITLEGPAGTVHLKEGLICARRHIHMHPNDANKLNVKDKDVVEIAIKGGPRDLTFGDVLVRVKDSYVLEMHIDTDEANACELNKGMAGDLIYQSVETAKGHFV